MRRLLSLAALAIAAWRATGPPPPPWQLVVTLPPTFDGFQAAKLLSSPLAGRWVIHRTYRPGIKHSHRSLDERGVQIGTVSHSHP